MKSKPHETATGLNRFALAKSLEVFGYQTTWQTGNHIRVTTLDGGEHHLTIPAHNPLKTGTLSAIVNAVALHFNVSRDELLKRLF